MHIGFGSPAVWGAGGQGSNAPEWLRSGSGAHVGNVPMTPNSAAAPQDHDTMDIFGGRVEAGGYADPIGTSAYQMPQTPRAAWRDGAW
jgi:hypothetical protein